MWLLVLGWRVHIFTIWQRLVALIHDCWKILLTFPCELLAWNEEGHTRLTFHARSCLLLNIGVSFHVMQARAHISIILVHSSVTLTIELLSIWTHSWICNVSEWLTLYVIIECHLRETFSLVYRMSNILCVIDCISVLDERFCSASMLVGISPYFLCKRD